MPLSKGKMENFTSQEIETRFWILARGQAEEAGLSFSHPCATAMRDLLRAGVRKMLRENRMEDADFDESERHLNQFVQTMVREAMETTPGQIRENSFVVAKRICPLWPFC